MNANYLQLLEKNQCAAASLQPRFVCGVRTAQRRLILMSTLLLQLVCVPAACQLLDHVSAYLDLNGRHEATAVVSH